MIIRTVSRRIELALSLYCWEAESSQVPGVGIYLGLRTILLAQVQNDLYVWALVTMLYTLNLTPIWLPEQSKMIYSSLFPNRHQATDSYHYVEALNMRIRHRWVHHHKSTAVKAQLKPCAWRGVTTTAPSKTLADTVENEVGCKHTFITQCCSVHHSLRVPLPTSNQTNPPQSLSLNTCLQWKLHVRPIRGLIRSFFCDRQRSGPMICDQNGAQIASRTWADNVTLSNVIQ